VAADYGPFQARLIDERTYVEQGLLWFDVARPALTRLVEEVRPDLLLVGAPVTDEFSHQFMAMTTPAYPGYDPARAAHYEELIRLAYRKTDEFLAHARALMPPNTVTVVSSDHGFGAAWKSVNANLVLQRAGLLHVDEAGRPSAASRAVSYAAGATANIYLNVRGRDPGGVVDPADSARDQERIIAAFTELRDPASPDSALVARALRREELAEVETSEGPANLLHPTRSGDVMLFLAPPYQFDGASPLEPVADAPMLGQHGYLPDVVDAGRGLNMRSAFLMDGLGVRAGLCITGARAIDLAPTLARALGITGPKHADGRVLHEALTPRPDLSQ
jgi:Type I phosphodiesterase / nucleotide pyrophosphatase